jgi:hypothetical protein
MSKRRQSLHCLKLRRGTLLELFHVWRDLNNADRAPAIGMKAEQWSMIKSDRSMTLIME